MKILVTGGCGFIFSNFIRYYLDNHPQDTIVNLDVLTYAGRVENTFDFNNNPRYKFIRGNIADEKLVNRLIKNIDIVVHGAAESHVDRSIQKPADFIKTNVYGTYVLLESARKINLKKFIHVSTDEVYGSLKTGFFKETDPLSPSSPYAASKAAADLLAMSYYTTYRLPVIITRSTNNFGPYQFPEKFISRLLTNAILGKELPVYGKGKNVRDWLYVEDNCRAVDLVMQKGKIGEIYNVGAGGKELNNLKIAKEIAQRFPKGRLASKSKVKLVADRLGHDFRYALDFSKIRKLGFNPRYNFQEGIEETIRWYKENQWWWKPLKKQSESIYKNWGLSPEALAKGEKK